MITTEGIVKDSHHDDQLVARSARDNADGRGLDTLVDVLETAGIIYWIDSGVLLGMIRNGGLNPWEKDIDLAIAGDQLPALMNILARFEDAGYDVSVNRYRGTVFSIGLKPYKNIYNCLLRASIHVYYEAGEYLWSPQVQLYVPPPAPDVFRGRRTMAGLWLQRIVDRWFNTTVTIQANRVSRAPENRTLTYRIARWCYRRIDRGFLAEIWPIREIYVSMTWQIPKRLVLPVGRRMISGHDYAVPFAVEDYLTLRYGNWRTPIENWCYWEDDGAIVREPPLNVRKRLIS